jgi:hypothetical protein
MLILEQEFFTHTGYWSALWNWPIPEDGTPEENENRKRTFTLDSVLEWVEKYENIDGAFVSLKHMVVSLHFTNRSKNVFFQ